MLKVWGRKSSSNVQALMWCIGELGLPYQRYDAGHIYKGTDTPEFLEMNPNSTVPVLKDGNNATIWETGAILRYLAASYGSQSFWPENIIKRTEVDKWAEWSKINIALGFTAPIFWRVVRTSPKKYDEKAIAKAVNNFENTLAIAEIQLRENKFLSGNELSLADIQFGHVLFRYYDIDIKRAEFPHLATYYQNLTKRSAYAEHVMLDYEELRVK